MLGDCLALLWRLLGILVRRSAIQDKILHGLKWSVHESILKLAANVTSSNLIYI
jgi:hypothetical protein